MIDSVLIISLATIASGIIALSLKLCFKSKCSDVSLCKGLIKIHRNVELEIKEEEKKIDDSEKKDNQI